MGADLVLNYLTERDHRWIEALLEVYRAAAGRPIGELRERLQEPLAVWAPKGKLLITRHVLERTLLVPKKSPVTPRNVRDTLFTLAALRGRTPRAVVIDEAARSLGISPTEVESALFADLKSDRVIDEPPRGWQTTSIAAQTNLAMASALLQRATEVRIFAQGDAYALVRQIRRLGLISVVDPAPEPPNRLQITRPSVGLHISGPLALFRQTRVYGRALASLVPHIVRCESYALTARCKLHPRGEQDTVLIRSGDPLPVGRACDRDHQLKDHFVRAFRKLTNDWDIISEPDAIPTLDGLVLPDIVIRPRRRPDQSWLLEIAGYFTRQSLARTLSQLARAGQDRVLVCVDRRRACSADALPEGPEIISYRRRIDAREVLRKLEAATQRITEP